MKKYQTILLFLTFFICCNLLGNTIYIDTSKIIIKTRYLNLNITPKVIMCFANEGLCAYEIVGDSIKKYDVKAYTFVFSKPNRKLYVLKRENCYFNYAIKNVLTEEIKEKDDFKYGYFTDIEVMNNFTQEKAIIRRRVYLFSLL